MSLDDLKMALISSCKSFDAKAFIPYLLDSRIRVAFPNKVRFYSYLKELVDSAQNDCTGHLNWKLEPPYQYNFKGGHNLCFYDEVHRYPRIILEFKEEAGILYLDAHPF